MSEKRKKQFALLAIAIFVLFWALIFWFIGRPLLRFVSEPEAFRSWVDAHGIWGRLAFLGMVILQVFVAIIPGEPLEIGAGYAFGAVEGTFLCLLGITAGSALIFLFVRRFGIKALEFFFSRERIESVKFLQNSRRLNLLVFIIFFIPGTPKDLLAYAVGLTKMKLSTWLLITATARIPSIITSTIGGDALGLGKYLNAIIVFAAAVLLALAGILVYRHIRKKHAGPEEENTEEKQ